MVIECGTSCNCELNCGNRETQKGVSVQLNIARVLNKGWGLFAAQFIHSGLFVCEYAGTFYSSSTSNCLLHHSLFF